MSKLKSGIWSVALPLSVIFLGAAYYVRMPGVREEVDARTPLVRRLLGRFVQESGTQIIILPGEQDPIFAKPKPSPPTTPLRMRAEPAPVPAPAVPPPVESRPQPAVVDLPRIAGDPSLWPKKVTLQKATKFPAVLNGQVVGELIAPAGAEATLKQMKDDQVALEFNGGGAWVPAADTDVLARAQAAQ